MAKHEEPCRYDAFMADVPHAETQEKIYTHLDGHLAFTPPMRSRSKKAWEQITSSDDSTTTGKVEP